MRSHMNASSADSTSDPQSSSSAALAPWTRLVCKDGVGLGLLPAAQQQAVLALVWSVLPPAAVLSEKQINQHLQSALNGGAAAFLDTDFVELRRWLVDAGWLQRDGFGREYRACAWQQLTPGQQDTASPLRGHDTGAWVSETRAASQAERARRRALWQAAQAT